MRIGVKGLTSHFMCVQIFHMMTINVPANVGVPPLDTQLQLASVGLSQAQPNNLKMPCLKKKNLTDSQGHPLWSRTDHGGAFIGEVP